MGNYFSYYRMCSLTIECVLLQEKASQLVGNYDKDRLGALINARDRFGWTAMHWLAEGCADDTEAKVDIHTQPKPYILNPKP